MGHRRLRRSLRAGRVTAAQMCTGTGMLWYAPRAPWSAWRKVLIPSRCTATRHQVATLTRTRARRCSRFGVLGRSVRYVLLHRTRDLPASILPLSTDLSRIRRYGRRPDRQTHAVSRHHGRYVRQKIVCTPPAKTKGCVVRLGHI